MCSAVWLGANRTGQLCLQELGDIAGPRPVPALRTIGEARKVQQLACGRSHTLLLQTDGLVMAFGKSTGLSAVYLLAQVLDYARRMASVATEIATRMNYWKDVNS